MQELEQLAKELDERLVVATVHDAREAELLDALRQVPTGPFVARMVRVWSAYWRL